MFTRTVNFLQIRDEVFFTEVFCFLFQHFTVANNGIHGSAQLMTHIRQKCAFRLICFLSYSPSFSSFFHTGSQFSSALLNFLFQSLVGLG